MKRRWLMIGVLVVAILAGWMVRDLSAASRHDTGDFDPHKVARLETDAWRSYYAHQKWRLFSQMAELLRTQYHMPFWRSWVAAYAAAHSAVVFQPGHNRAEYERAMPDLVRFYTLIHKGSDTDFSVDEVARLELEWWIVHRERKSRAPGDLERALAMAVRDTRAELGSVSEEDWAHIRDLLDRSWVSLKSAIAP